MASAALLTRLVRAVESRPIAFEYRGLDHQPGGSHVPDAVLDGDQNGVVDFRYTVSQKLTWYFDHHATGIVGDEERARFDSATGQRKYFDPSYGSCTKLIEDVARDDFGVDLTDLSELIRWAHIIDTAGFESAEAAGQLEEPALQLMAVLEVHGDDAFLGPRIRAFADGASLAEVASQHEVKKRFKPLRKLHDDLAAQIEERARCESAVVTFDLVGNNHDRYGKFIPYRLYPDARYSVAVTANKTRAKVSVGSNPWSSVPRAHDIAAICARYGGGGHAVVGAVSLPTSELERARAIAAEIAELLRS